MNLLGKLTFNPKIIADISLKVLRQTKLKSQSNVFRKVVKSLVHAKIMFVSLRKLFICVKLIC